MQSFFTAWIETKPIRPVRHSMKSVQETLPAFRLLKPGWCWRNNISDDPNEYEMGPGTVTHLAPGEKVAFRPVRISRPQGSRRS